MLSWYFENFLIPCKLGYRLFFVAMHNGLFLVARAFFSLYLGDTYWSNIINHGSF